MSFQKNWNNAVAWAQSLGLPKLFQQFPTPKKEQDQRLYKRVPERLPQAPRTPTSIEVGSVFLPARRIEPKKLTASSIIRKAEPSMVTPQTFPRMVNSKIWKEKPLPYMAPKRLSQ